MAYEHLRSVLHCDRVCDQDQQRDDQHIALPQTLAIFFEEIISAYWASVTETDDQQM